MPAAAARRTCAPAVTFGRSQVSSPVLAAAQPHGTTASPPLASAPRPGRHPGSWRALAGRAWGAHETSALSLVLTNAQITPRAAFMRCPGGALPTARYSPWARSSAQPAAARGRCANHGTLPPSASEPTEGRATSEARPPRSRGSKGVLPGKGGSSPSSSILLTVTSTFRKTGRGRGPKPLGSLFLNSPELGGSSREMFAQTPLKSV